MIQFDGKTSLKGDLFKDGLEKIGWLEKQVNSIP